MAHATVRTIEIGRLPDHAEHGFIPKDRTISAAAAGLWVATHNPARTILLLENVTPSYIASKPIYKDRLRSVSRISLLVARAVLGRYFEQAPTSGRRAAAGKDVARPGRYYLLEEGFLAIRRIYGSDFARWMSLWRRAI